MERHVNSEAPPLRVLAAVALLAAATLGLQVSLTRHFSYLYWHHFAFMIIGIGMLGFGAAGAWLTRAGGISGGERAHQYASVSSIAAALAVLGYLWYGTAIDFEPLDLLTDPRQFFQLLILYFAILVPYVALGLAQGSILAGYRVHAARVYGADLLGAGVGCLLTLALLARLSATSAMLVWGGCAALAGGLLSQGLSKARVLMSWLVAASVAALTLAGFGDARFFMPAPSKDISFILRNKLAQTTGLRGIERTVSSPTMRLDVSRQFWSPFVFGGDVDLRSLRGRPGGQLPLLARVVYQDGAAPTVLYNAPDPMGVPALGLTSQGLAYQIRRNPRVCVIGAGGGADVLIALHNGARSVTAVEVNPQMLSLGRDLYRDFVAGLFDRDNVLPVVAEGRHFLGSTRERFDLIQMSGVDTFAALASGAYAMSENYLYTVEAGRAFLRALTPDGLFTNSRWFLEPPRETLRLVNILMESLRREGSSDPAAHLFVVRGDLWATTLVSRRPFTAPELDVLRRWTAERGWSVVLDPDGRGSEPFVRLVHGSQSERRRFLAEYAFDVSAATDDRPFFFEFYRWRNLFRSADSKGGYVITRMPVGYAVLAASLIQMGLLSAIFILGPLWSERSRLRGQSQLVRRLVFFSVLGLGFMGIEVASIQAVTVFLGAPVYSMAVTLASLLVATGIGSLRSGRSGHPQRLMRDAVVGIGAWAALTYLLLAPLLDVAIGWPLIARGTLVALWLFPAGLCLGVPFPTAIRSLQSERPALAPWAWSVNACASVIGTLAVVLASMKLGFRATMMLSAGLYCLGYLSWRATVRSSGHGVQMSVGVSPEGDGTG